MGIMISIGFNGQDIECFDGLTLQYLDWMNVFCVLIKLSNMITLEQKWVNHCHIDIWVLTLVVHSTGKGRLVIGQSKLQEPFYLF